MNNSDAHAQAIPEAAVELPEPMRQILEQATAAYVNADRKAYERWKERCKA